MHGWDWLTCHLIFLAEFPDRGRRGPIANFRELVVAFGRSAYVLRYRVGEAEVLITRIRHAREQ